MCNEPEAAENPSYLDKFNLMGKVALITGGSRGIGRGIALRLAEAGHQKELSHLLDDARKRRFEALLVWALDRLSREGPLAILTLVNRLKNCGVKQMC